MVMQKQERASKIPPHLRVGSMVAAGIVLMVQAALHYSGRSEVAHIWSAITAFGFSCLALLLTWYKSRDL